MDVSSTSIELEMLTLEQAAGLLGGKGSGQLHIY